MKKKRMLAQSRVSHDMGGSTEETTYVFRAGNLLDDNNEMLKITEDGFWVRGVQVASDDKEAKVVFEAFKQWLAWSALSREH